MKQRTIIRARAKSAIEVYQGAGKRITDVLVMTHLQLFDRHNVRYTQNDFVAVFYDGDNFVDFDGFATEADAVVFSRDARKNAGLDACETRVLESA